ncbi:Glycoside Hydrolase Family 35 protein [Gigaspora rosea]|uniref:beta-galactosidase n=1 Tax=Gigaspora rosea TaxID=44941 RepID=A0A397VAL4_9GLOM|nr:Glycoside Hydrolase Family 35 protein [Gigaspora rosea]
MAIPELAALLTVLPAGLVAFYVWLLQSRKGSLPITTAECAYDKNKYGEILNWDKFCLYIHGKPTLIISGEFHYFRVPDKSRWESILKKYRAGGFNCVRLYFHWGYHSPDEGIYNFEDNRDIDYLLNLCESLNLYVLAAPGPYICAETQAGGFPFWVLDKVKRVRHMSFTGFKKYDPEFSAFQKQWFENVLPIIAKHQITTKQGGCVIAVQIENELFDKVIKIPYGLPDEMKFLAKVARDCEINVPLFTNDPEEVGSFIINRGNFGLDLYGFDKYFVFVPASSPTPWAFNVVQDPKKWKPWKPKDAAKSLDVIEQTVRGFGYEAANTPIFIPELQGGWFSTYKLQHTFDDVYNFYGDAFTRTAYESVLAQGCTMASIYMVYGGTNWGTVGDVDGYTSYDYSACIREYGYTSSRMRELRLGINFIRSFSDLFTKTERVKNPNVSTSIKNVFNLQRKSVMKNVKRGDEVLFSFFRNFNEQQNPVFQVYVKYKEGQRREQTFSMRCYLQYKTSFVTLGNYTTITGLKLIFSTLPIHLRIIQDRVNEIWIVPVNDVGELAFQGEVTVDGNLIPSIRKVGHAIHIVSFNDVGGFARIRSADSSGDLYILALRNESLSTLHAIFEEPYWTKINNDTTNISYSPSIVTWGIQDVYFDSSNSVLETQYGDQEHDITILFSREPSKHVRFQPHPTYPLPFISKKQFTAGEKTSEIHLVPKLVRWRSRTTNFNDLEWRTIDLKNGGPIENYYASGHILYNTRFSSNYSSSKVYLSINMRHRCTIFVNGRFVGGHTTFSRQLFFPGSKNGPELFKSLGGKKYDITQFLHPNGDEEKNSVIILVENWGINRQAVIFNDCRNPRGIISSNIDGLVKETNLTWSICGVDLRKLDNPFNTSGIPDEENKNLEWKESEKGISNYGVIPNDGIKWWSFRFSHPMESKFKDILNAPLRLVLQGAFTSYIFLNGTIIGRYYGNGDCAQHDYYLMDGLLKFGDEENQITMMVYSWETVNPEEIIVEVRGWEIDDVKKTGNLIKLKKGVDEDIEFEVKPWIVRKELIPLT